MNILEARSKLAAVLAPVLEGDPTVLTDLVDSITPPALMISWGEPWMTFQTPCFNNAQLVVTAVGSRLVPGAGQAQVEALVDFVITRVRLDSPNWSLTTVSGMRVFPIAQTNYLASRITLQVTID